MCINRCRQGRVVTGQRGLCWLWSWSACLIGRAFCRHFCKHRVSKCQTDVGQTVRQTDRQTEAQLTINLLGFTTYTSSAFEHGDAHFSVLHSIVSWTSFQHSSQTGIIIAHTYMPAKLPSLHMQSLSADEMHVHKTVILARPLAKQEGHPT